MERNSIRKDLISDECFNISRNLLAVLNDSFSKEFILLDDFLKIEGKSNDYLFYNLDEVGALDSFVLGLECGYQDDDGDLCCDRIDINLDGDNGIVYYNRFCLFQGETPINEINKAMITTDGDTVIISYSKVINDGVNDYEDCSDHFVDIIEFERSQFDDLLKTFDKPIDKHLIIK